MYLSQKKRVITKISGKFSEVDRIFLAFAYVKGLLQARNLDGKGKENFSIFCGGGDPNL